MPELDIPLCDHLKTDGVLCGSPALRGNNFCYFHDQWRKVRPNQPQPSASRPVLDIPLLEDANAVQMALQQVITAIVQDQISHKKAGLLLYALQTASANLKRVCFEPEELHDQMQAELEEPELESAAQEETTAPENIAEEDDETADQQPATSDRRPLASESLGDLRKLARQISNVTGGQRITADG